MTNATLKATVAAFALTAGSAFAAGDVKSNSADANPPAAAAGSVTTNRDAAPEIDSEITSNGAVQADGSAATSTTGITDTGETGAPLPDSFAGMTVGEVVGLGVESEAGDDLGEIDYIVEQNGDQVAIVGVGGFLGLGEHDVAVPLSDMTFTAEDQVTLANWTEEQLEAQPDVDEANINALDDDVMIERDL